MDESRPRGIVPAFLDPDTKAALDRLGSAVEARLGLSGAHWVVVTHRKYPDGAGFCYDLAVACEKTPELIRTMRRCFPRTRQGPFRAFTGPFGDLNLENVTIDHLRTALAKVPAVKLP